MNTNEVLKQALGAITTYLSESPDASEEAVEGLWDAVNVARKALAQPAQQEPVAWMDADGNVSDNNDHNCFPIPLYTSSPAAQTEQKRVVNNCKHEWMDETKDHPQWRCIKCGTDYVRELNND